jgi:hypothetical protein
MTARQGRDVLLSEAVLNSLGAERKVLAIWHHATRHRSSPVALDGISPPAGPRVGLALWWLSAPRARKRTKTKL